MCGKGRGGGGGASKALSWMAGVWQLDELERRERTMQKKNSWNF